MILHKIEKKTKEQNKEKEVTKTRWWGFRIHPNCSNHVMAASKQVDSLMTMLTNKSMMFGSNCIEHHKDPMLYRLGVLELNHMNHFYEVQNGSWVANGRNEDDGPQTFPTRA